MNPHTKRLSALIVLLLFCKLSSIAQVSISLAPTQKGIEVSPSLYGIFYEDINFASDGGLYAELIRNRSFEYDDRQPAHWQAIDSRISLTSDNLLNDNQQHALRVEMATAGSGISNPGYWGINAVRGTQYKLSFWVRSEKGTPGSLKAMLASKDGTTLGETVIPCKTGSKWQKVEATIIATGSDPQAEFRLLSEKPCTLVMDVISLFPPTFKGRENGCRIDLAEKLAALHPAFMRFPGGCYVEGNIRPENAYHWERTVGPIEQRPGHMNANWGYPTTDGLGFHEFLQLSEDLGAKPLYVVNIGIWHGGCTPLDSLQPWIDECLGALEYANGPVTSRYGRMRAENGHPEPFGIAYIEIGNENYNYHMDDNSDQSDHYPERYRMFYDAIKARFPEVQCIGNVESWGTDHPKWRNDNPVDILDEHYYRNPQWFVGQFNRFDDYDRQGPVIYPGEYAVTSGYGTTGNMNAALGEAVFMMGMERNSDIVRMSSYAPIFVNENSIQWRPDMIRFNASQSFGTPSYWVQQLFPTHIGNRVIPSHLEWQLPDEQPQNTAPVQVGLGTWRTQASFRNMQIIADSEPVGMPELSKWAIGRRDRKGQWSIKDGIISQTARDEGTTFLCPTPISSRKYSYQLEARRDSGDEGFLIIFDYQDNDRYTWFNIGGWNNTRSKVEQFGGTAVTNEREDHLETGRWYKIRIDVDGTDFTCFIDGKEHCKGRLSDGTMRGVYTVSTLDEKTGTLYTKIVNLGSTGAPGTISLTDGSRAVSAEIVRLNAMSGEDENTMRYPDNIVPRPAKASIASDGKTIRFDVVPYSVNIITTKLLPHQ